MAQIKHVKDLPVVDPSGAKFFVLKNGLMSQTDLSTIIEKVKAFDPAKINESFEKTEKLITSLNAKLEAAEKKIEELSSALDAMVIEAVPAQAEETETVEEVVEEAPKKTKKSKKSAE